MNTRVGFNEHTYSFAMNIDNGHPSVSGRTGKWNRVIVGTHWGNPLAPDTRKSS